MQYKERKNLQAELESFGLLLPAEQLRRVVVVAAMNADNAEQLMYISAGLSLVILPEHDVTGVVDMSAYTDRAPTNPETGQRVRSISAAAAAAGEVILDRARKGAAMRMERQRRQQSQSGEDAEKGAESNYSRLSLLSNNAATVAAPPVTFKVVAAAIPTTTLTPETSAPAKTQTISIASTPKPVKRPIVAKTPIPTPPANPAISAKAIRARVQANMSVQTLLSLQPSAEELRSDGKHCAATIALIERGVGHGGPSGKNLPQKHRHPFPDSLGARRRTATVAGSKKDESNLSQLEPLALPSYPTPKERRTRKRVSVIDPQTASSLRATSAIQSVIDLFLVKTSRYNEEGETVDQRLLEKEGLTRPRKRRLAEISFSHSIQKLCEQSEGKAIENSSLESTPLPELRHGGEAKSDNQIDVILAYNVMKAVGLVKEERDDEQKSSDFRSKLDPSLFRSFEVKADSEEGGQSRRSVAKLKNLWKRFSTQKRTFTDKFYDFRSDLLNRNVQSEAERKSSPNTAPLASRNVDQSSRSTFEGTVESSSVKAVDPTKAHPLVPIRGGGEVLLESDGGSKSSKSQESGQQPVNGAKSSEAKAGEERRDKPSSQDVDQQQRNARGSAASRRQDQATQQPVANVHGADLTHRMVWNDPSHQSLVLLNPPLSGSDSGYGLTPSPHQTPLIQHGNGGPAVANRLQGQLPDHYHHHSTANALQLAHHLRHATASISRLPPHGHNPAGDLAEYIGGLHHSQAPGGYDWTSLGAVSVQSLAAFGMNHHRAAMVNFSVQDRARVLLAREQQSAAAAAQVAAHRQSLSSQQAVAFLGGAPSHGYAQSAAPHFSHLGGHSAATAALLNSSALMGHSNMQQLQSAVPSASSIPPTKPDQRSADVSRKEQSPKKDKAKDQSSKRELPSKKELQPKKEQPPKKGKPRKDELHSESAKVIEEKARDENTNRGESSSSKKRKLSDSDGCSQRQEKRCAVPSETANGGESDGVSRVTTQGKETVKPTDENSKAALRTIASPKKSNEQTDERKTQATHNNTESEDLSPPVVSKEAAAPRAPASTQSSTAVISKTSSNDKGCTHVVSAKTPLPESSAVVPLPENISIASNLENKSAVSLPENKTVASSPENKAVISLPEVKASAPLAEVNMTASLPEVSTTASLPTGLQFFVPPAPPLIAADIASLVLTVRGHEALELIDSSELTSVGAALVDYITSVGTAVPIPKALVASPLKDRITISGFKNGATQSLNSIPREVSGRLCVKRNDISATLIVRD